MAIETPKFRIEPDPQRPGCWQFVDLRRGQIVPGFKTAKAARRAYDREAKETSS